MPWFSGGNERMLTLKSTISNLHSSASGDDRAASRALAKVYLGAILMGKSQLREVGSARWEPACGIEEIWT
jgi:hypothetical protein